MRLLLIGYGKMGKTIEQLALGKGHTIAGIIDHSNTKDLQNYNAANTDAAIEFTQPESAFANISYCLENGIPVVSGSTGWLTKFEDAKKLAQKHRGSFFYASNFRVGVNLVFHFNEYIASRMQKYADYGVSVKEVHHTQKLDQPSGTAITIADGIMQHYPGKKGWVNQETGDPQQLGILSERHEDVVGTHYVYYTSDNDTIELTHTAHNRQGFAEGALLAAEWLPGKPGVWSMKDLLKL
jgi:4-hydroxy-tetrahydrodipicolinate reductase